MLVVPNYEACDSRSSMTFPVLRKRRNDPRCGRFGMCLTAALLMVFSATTVAIFGRRIFGRSSPAREPQFANRLVVQPEPAAHKAATTTANVRSNDNSANSNNSGNNNHKMKLTSSAFAHGDAIPAVYTRKDGDNRSPPLAWSDSPPNTQSFALIVDDPDAPDPAAPKMTWVHWVLYNLPATVTSLPAGDSAGTAAANDWKNRHYDGPAPPVGAHRYFFKLYALDTVLSDGKIRDKASLLQAMQGHVLDAAELVGTYQKQQRR